MNEYRGVFLGISWHHRDCRSYAYFLAHRAMEWNMSSNITTTSNIMYTWIDIKLVCSFFFLSFILMWQSIYVINHTNCCFETIKRAGIEWLRAEYAYMCASIRDIKMEKLSIFRRGWKKHFDRQERNSSNVSHYEHFESTKWNGCRCPLAIFLFYSTEIKQTNRCEGDYQTMQKSVNHFGLRLYILKCRQFWIISLWSVDPKQTEWFLFFSAEFSQSN